MACATRGSNRGAAQSVSSAGLGPLHSLWQLAAGMFLGLGLATFALASLTATLLPTRRVTKIDPVLALTGE